MMGNKELLDCGALLAGLQTWFAYAFAMVLAALHDDIDADCGLRATAVTLLHDGVLHIETAGHERFNVDAYLQLSADESGASAFPAPRMIWQIVASTSDTGRKPRLDLSDWDLLPHMAPDQWDSEVRGTSAVCVGKGEKYRYLVLYHAPGDWDARRNELLVAWKKILPKMNGKNFMMKDARELLFRALPEPSPLTTTQAHRA